MPLSDRERKELEELESGLAADDPRLAQALASGSVGPTFRLRTYFGALIGVVGLVLLIAGISTQLIVVGVAGFMLMGVGTSLLLDKRTFNFGRRPKVN